MDIQAVATQPFDGQKPGTSGLRKKVDVFQQPHYVANFTQAIVNALSPEQRGRLVVGGDGRYFNAEAIQVILKVLVGNGIREVLVGADGILSTPAVSNLIRKSKADGGIVLSASHNPGGPGKDFGIKFNNASGSPAPENITQAIYDQTRSISEYQWADLPELKLEAGSEYTFLDTKIRVVDSVDDYAALMQTLFDFDRIGDAIRSGGLSVCFDGMHAVTGPYARRIFGDLLGVSQDRLWNCDALTDFGGGHPDPNRVYAKTLYDFMMGESATDLGAASDGDGDRNMIMGRGAFVSPSDSLALIAQHHQSIPQFKSGLVGVARSMPTSTALDRVAQHLNISCYETPTGWKFFGNLLDQGLVRLCGEESFGTSGDHVREKDGVWTVLCWLSILADKQVSAQELLAQHWTSFGRSYYCRHDYEGLDADKAQTIIDQLAGAKGKLLGRKMGAMSVADVNVFRYEDPVDGSVSENQGVRVVFDDHSRVVYRLSGTGTDSATLRVYLEQIERDAQNQGADAIVYNESLGQFANDIADIQATTGLSEPTVKT
ncbi:alpha-D-glucose phosphate-specific phosphoglucomutase [Ketobacter sp.]|uniref:alpha-D-glucose phosphate-specific phosphoglucomutase n=1 Tax=Ketobacter sp. TaxID=2083498 RepID=UPI000F113FBC|nr:alpha-D-glucose phosphate-specific phosphoglucomutase [Ketobacter sp.]RLT97394.1 MAG: alpha-D-glucose phosphate-specific phosphoglucomutase [Ketobacter sp.]